MTTATAIAQATMSALSQPSAELRRNELRKVITSNRKLPHFLPIHSYAGAHGETFSRTLNRLPYESLVAMLARLISGLNTHNIEPEFHPSHIIACLSDHSLCIDDNTKRARSKIPGHPITLHSSRLKELTLYIKGEARHQFTDELTTVSYHINSKHLTPTQAMALHILAYTTGRYYWRTRLARTQASETQRDTAQYNLPPDQMALIEPLLITSGTCVLDRACDTHISPSLMTAFRSASYYLHHRNEGITAMTSISAMSELLASANARIAAGETTQSVLNSITAEHGSVVAVAIKRLLDPATSAASSSSAATITTSPTTSAPTTTSTPITTPTEPTSSLTIDPALATGINSILAGATKGAITDIGELLEARSNLIAVSASFNDLQSKLETLTTKTKTTIDKMREDHARELAAIKLTSASAPSTMPATNYSLGELPECTVEWVNAQETFSITSKLLDFNVPTFKWADDPGSLVPTIDPSYTFDETVLHGILYGLVTNKPIWLWGPTGCGKSTFYEQIAARLRWVFGRINFDSDIDRMALVGKDVLKVESGATASTFVHGSLPQYMLAPAMLVLDEIDSARADCTYVMQRVTEGNGLLIPENGNELITAHQWFRICATANTAGHGDELNIYPSVRPQSQAFLNRFGVKIDTDYMAPEKESQMLVAKTGIKPDMATKISDFMKRCRDSFKQGTVGQAFSPRDSLDMAEHYMRFTNIELSIRLRILGGAAQCDKRTLAELANAVFATKL